MAERGFARAGRSERTPGRRARQGRGHGSRGRACTGIPDARFNTNADLAGGGALIGGGPIFGLLSAFSWGAGDFCGGLVSRYTSVILAILTSQGVGLALALAVLAASGEAAPTFESVAWAAFAGAGGLTGLGCFYLALSRGTMGVVAPLSAAIGAGLPVMVAIAGGEVVSTGRFAGIALALVAVVMISLPARPETKAERRTPRIDLGELPLVVLTGLGFATFFIGLDRASVSGAMWWPLGVVRVVGVALALGAFGVLIARMPGPDLRSRARSVLGIDRLRARRRTVAAMLPLLALTGLGDMGGNTFFVLARGADAFSVAVALSSLYPVVTTILAAVFLRERLRRTQIGGVVLATISVPLLR